MDDEKSLKKIKTGLFDRSLSLTRFALQSGAQAALTSVKTAFADSQHKELAFRLLLEAQAKLLSKELGVLKGSLMKVGQLLALYGEHFLPEEVVKSLKTLNEESPCIAFAEMHKLLVERLGEEKLAELDIEPVALAAASMGQVHRARIKATGEWICLKIQYPGVEKAIDSDIKALRRILSLMKVLPKDGEGYEALFDEIRDMLEQELDYERERSFTEAALAALAGDERFIVPRIYARYSGPKILASSYEAGISLDAPEVKALSQTRRNQLALDFSWLFVNELFHLRLMQTDPHFGNFKIRLRDEGCDQWVLLDWGAVREFSEPFIAHYKKMLQAALANDTEAVQKAGLALGLLRENDSEALKKAFTEICSNAVEPWLPPQDARVHSRFVDGQGHYLWSQSDLPNRITSLAAKFALSFRLRPPPREFIFLDRKIGGVFIILKILDARFAGHRYLEDWLVAAEKAP